MMKPAAEMMEIPMLSLMSLSALVTLTLLNAGAGANDFSLRLRYQNKAQESDRYQRLEREEHWKASETAVIVCDVWDLHHSLNAVRRMNEFVPRMNEMLDEARSRGAVVIHSPSDCMPAYVHHPARQRAIDAPQSEQLPRDIEFWCSRIPSEEAAAYPLDQSDGGDDDDPDQHAEWADQLAKLGRNPALPWKTQSPGIRIDDQVDYISDRGDEVWNILESRGIRNVILTGVHTNMCVLGRPFGLRQMVRNGKNVVLTRDLTDCMYNPRQWPFVDHFTGNDLIVSHIERFVCPTITSDQILGGSPFVSAFDHRSVRDITDLSPSPPEPGRKVAGDIPAEVPDVNQSADGYWTTRTLGEFLNESSEGTRTAVTGSVWYRCTTRLPSSWLAEGFAAVREDQRNSAVSLTVHTEAETEYKAWINGRPLIRSSAGFLIPEDAIMADDINLLVIRCHSSKPQNRLMSGPVLRCGSKQLELHGRWHVRVGDVDTWSTIPLPAKFGIGPDVLFEAGR